MFIDGTKVASVDLYNPTTQFERVVFEKRDLGASDHTIKIVATGTKNAASSATLQSLSAFMVKTS